MDMKHIQRFGQYEELQFENYVDWSIAFYGDDISSDEEGLTELVSKWIIGKKRKRSSKEHLDQQRVKDLIINVKQKKTTQLSTEQHNSKELIIDESIKNIPHS
jgi:hypothetical protein